MCIVKGATEQVPLEGLIEPSESGSLSKHLLVGCLLNKISQWQNVTIPVLNTSPSPIKIYKGACIGSLTPRNEVFYWNRKTAYSMYLITPLIPMLMLN